MKNNVYSKIKNGKAFSYADLIIYAAVFVVLAALFIAIIIIPSNTVSAGFVVSVNDKDAFIYEYQSGKYEIKDFDGKIEIGGIDTQNTFTFTVFTGEDGYNVLEVSPKDKTVKVVESNCSSKKDCVYTPPLKNGSGAIFCMPHGVKILPLNLNYRNVSTGGV